MKVVALVSGGKDSCYNMMQCVMEGHQILALANLKPEKKDELDSYMFQTVGHHGIDLYAEAIGLPLYRHTIKGYSKTIDRDYTVTENDEVEDLLQLLKRVKEECDVEAVSVGAILSDYQRVRVENVCLRLGLTSLAYLWRRDQEELLKEMIDSNLTAVLIKVASLGLEPKHLGKTLAEMHPHLQKMKDRFQLNVCGEGGEYETFTLDCPLFKKRIVLDEVETVIHSDDAFAPVAYLNIKKAHLEDKMVGGQNNSMFDRVKALPMLHSGQLLSSLNLDDEGPGGQPPPSARAHNSALLTVSDEKRFMVIREQDNVWITGLCGISAENSSLAETTTLTMNKLRDTLQNLPDISCDMSCVAMVCLYVQDMSMFAAVNTVYKTYFGMNPPARICVEAALPVNVALQIDCYCNTSLSDRQTMHVQGLSHWAPANIGPYSQCVQVRNKLYVAGQIAMCPANLSIISGGIIPQARLSLRHVRMILEAMHCGMDRLTTVVCYVTDVSYIKPAQNEFEEAKTTNETGEEFGIEKQTSPLPVTVYVVVPRLPKDALIEWQVTARKDLWNLSIAEWTKAIQRGLFRCSMKFLHTDEEIISSAISIIGNVETAGASSTKEVSDCFCELVHQAHECLPQTITSIFPLRIFFSTSQHNINDLYQNIYNGLEYALPKSQFPIILVPVVEFSSPELLLMAVS